MSGRIVISELNPKYAIAKLQSGGLAKIHSGLLLRKNEGSEKEEQKNPFQIPRLLGVLSKIGFENTK